MRRLNLHLERISKRNTDDEGPDVALIVGSVFGALGGALLIGVAIAAVFLVLKKRREGTCCHDNHKNFVTVT
jgi:hypothetical protein